MNGLDYHVVLFADDDAGVSYIFGSLLQREGYKVFSATNAASAWTKFTTLDGRVGNIVLDNNLDGRHGHKKGVDLLREMRDWHREKYGTEYQGGMILFTALSEDYDARALAKIGITLLSKPIEDPDDLLKALKKDEKQQD